MVGEHGIIDPLKIAARLWAASRGHPLPEEEPGPEPEAEPVGGRQQRSATVKRPPTA